MKKTILVKSVIILFVTVLLSSCDLLNNNDDTKQNDEYLVSYNKKKTLLTSVIKMALETQTNSYPDIQSIIDKMQHSVSVYSISYITTFKGEQITASGLVAVPLTTGIEFPIMSFQNGTNTLHSLAPSVNPDSQLYLMLESIASTGFIISIPDYLGFGTSDQMFHPYLDKESTVQTVTDMLHAVKELINNHLNIEVSNDLYITGYSQGGWATMQLQKAIETQYSSEFNLKASACAAGPYDLNFINNYVLGQTTYPMPYFLGYVFNSYINLGDITTPASDVFNSPYDNIVTTYYDGTHSGEEINGQLTTSVSSLFTEDYRNNVNTDEKFASVISSMSANSISAWNTVTPMMILHGTADDFVPPQVSLNIYQDFLTEGVNPEKIIYLPLPGETHTSGVIPAELASIKWFLDLKDAQ